MICSASTGWISKSGVSIYLVSCRCLTGKSCQRLMKAVETDVTVNLNRWGIHNVAIQFPEHQNEEDGEDEGCPLTVNGPRSREMNMCDALAARKDNQFRL